MRTAQYRVLISLAATIFAAACGMLAGYLVDRAITLNLAKDQLKEYAMRIMNEGEASSAESRAVLARMNSSPYPPCSKAEQLYVRKLIFQSEYLRDAGRMQDDKILCSTTLGLLKPPLMLGKADYFEANAQPVLAQGWLFGGPVPAEQFHRDWKERTRLEREPAELV
jgi:sensor c-di-GMP phosphodiesterase-like protein